MKTDILTYLPGPVLGTANVRSYSSFRQPLASASICDEGWNEEVRTSETLGKRSRAAASSETDYRQESEAAIDELAVVATTAK